MNGRANDIYFSQLQQLLTNYDEKKGRYRSLFFDSEGIDELRDFCKRKSNDSDVLNDGNVKSLITILENRFNRVLKSNRSYRAKPDRLTNQIFTEIAQWINKRNNDPKILMLVQYYRNDYAINKSLLYKTKENLFFSETGYVISIDLIDYLQKTMSYTFPSTTNAGSNESNKFEKLTEKDLVNLKNIPAASRAINQIAGNFEKYNNQNAIDGSSLLEYPSDHRFLTEDNFCFLMADIISAYKNQNKFYNFYTNQPFSERDMQKLSSNSEVLKEIHSRKASQIYHASQISNQTILQLAEFADGLLNNREILAKAYNKVDIAQNANDKFSLYYSSMPDAERIHLDEFWIEQFSTI